MSISADAPIASAELARPKARFPRTFWLGLAIIVAGEALLFTDVVLSHRGALHTTDAYLALPRPAGWLAKTARCVAANMTPLAWTGLLLLLDGLLAHTPAGSPARRRPHHFWLCCLASVFIWCVFDLINFWIFAPHHAWRYIGMPPAFSDRLWGYLLAFGTIVPGMLLIGQVYLEMGLFDWARTRPRRMPLAVKLAAFAMGVAMFAWPMVARNQVTNYTLWTSLVFLLDPINLMLGRPSMLRDWERGWYGRTLAAFAGGLTCGLLWEFWNYWALAKWVYDLPFLGTMEHYKYFEMPLPGLLGFLPFGIECWVMWQTIRIPLDGLVEPLPDERTLM
jgi:hypothetical protein